MKAFLSSQPFALRTFDLANIFWFGQQSWFPVFRLDSTNRDHLLEVRWHKVMLATLFEFDT